MTRSERWIEERLGSAPRELLDVMRAAVRAHDLPDVPEALAAAAIALYKQVVDGAGGREDALPLLAADALLTHAFEAAAEADPSSIGCCAQRWGGRGGLGKVAA
ncbi:MAG: hypothetical protein GEU90_07285 [Gemmatimonas sp.]|nr:hypothetical protein [Gemmatimonas sp.]